MAKKTPAVTSSTLPVAYDYGDHAGKGYEGQTQDDIKIPLLSLLQKGSPQVEEGDLTAGHIFNSVTEEAKAEVLFIPAITRHHYIEWVPRDSGGGFVATHDLHSEVVRKAQAAAKASGAKRNELVMPDGVNELSETFEMSGVEVDKDGKPLGMVVIPFTSSKIKPYRDMNTKLQSFMIQLENGRKIKPPLFAHVLRLKGFLDKNKQDQRYYNFEMTPWKGNLKEGLLPLDHPGFKAAEEVWSLVTEGKATAAHETATNEPDEDMPF